MNAFSDAEVPFAQVARAASAISVALTARVVARRERATMSAGS